jgi:CHASE1-domain containing sensor protein
MHIYRNTGLRAHVGSGNLAATTAVAVQPRYLHEVERHLITQANDDALHQSVASAVRTASAASQTNNRTSGSSKCTCMANTWQVLAPQQQQQQQQQTPAIAVLISPMFCPQPKS